MAVTKMSDVINTEVMAPMIEEKIAAQLKLTPYAKVDTTLVGVAGNTVTIPTWGYIGDAEDVGEDVEIDLVKLSKDSDEFTIKKAAKSVGISQEAVNSGYGDPIGTAGRQLGKAIAGKLDSDSLDAAYTGSVVYAPGTLAPIGYSGLVDANAKFLDEEDGIEKVIFIHPKQEASLLKDSAFTSADKFEAGVAVNGSIGKITGCWVKKSLKVKLIKFEANAAGSITIVSDETTETSTAKHLSTVQPYCAAVLAVGDKVNAAGTEYWLNPIIKMQPDSPETEYNEDEMPAITVFLKKDIQVDAEWLPRRQRHEITAAKYYGVALTNNSKVVLAKFSDPS